MTQATYLTVDGEERQRPLAVLNALEVASGQPIRVPPSHVGQTNYPGLFWSSTMGRHLVYESLLELSWLWLADFSQDVVAIAAQPMRLVGRDRDRPRTRYPDFLTVRADGRVVVIDVKAERMLQRQPVREALDWTARQIEGCGWEYLVWTGAPLTELRNVRLVAAARRPRFVPQAAVDAVVARCGSEGVEIGALERTISHMDTGFSARQAILAALWAGRLRCDMSRPIQRDTVVRAC